MFAGDNSRKTTLVEHGFRLPSALDNRPLKFDEWEQKIKQVIYVSATPGPYELEQTGGEFVEQVIRPTGLLDPIIEVAPARTQVPHLLGEIRERAAESERVLVTTLTKRLAEDLSAYLVDQGVKCKWLHSELDAFERVQLLRELREGRFETLVGVNLLREGLDLPEVSLVAILDADKEGFLRSGNSLIQTIGRAARHVEGQAILYADKTTGSMRRAIDETVRRRHLQQEYNERRGITPASIERAIEDLALSPVSADYSTVSLHEQRDEEIFEDAEALEAEVGRLEKKMLEAAERLDFELAATRRDRIRYLREKAVLG